MTLLAVQLKSMILKVLKLQTIKRQAKTFRDNTIKSCDTTPSDIISIPKIELNRKRRRQGKKSEILSRTPYKNILEENENEKT